MLRLTHCVMCLLFRVVVDSAEDEVSCLWSWLINMSPESLQTWNLWKYGDKMTKRQAAD